MAWEYVDLISFATVDDKTSYFDIPFVCTNHEKYIEYSTNLQRIIQFNFIMIQPIYILICSLIYTHVIFVVRILTDARQIK